MVNSDIYSPHKLIHHKKKIQALKDGCLIVPTQVQIDLTNKCNHNCLYCFYHRAKDAGLNELFYESDTIPYDKVIEILNDCKSMGVSAIQLTGGGEPSMHPQFTEIVDEIIRLGLELALVTNGVKLKPHNIDQLTHATWVRFSLDAATPETYAKSQGVSEKEFHTACHNISTLKQKCSNTTIGTSFVINPVNYREVLLATRLVRDLGADNIRLSAAYTNDGFSLFENIWTDIEKLAFQAKLLQTDDFIVFDLAMDHLDNLALKHKGYTECGYQHFTAVIGADQMIYPCCTLKYNRKGQLGSISNDKFSSVWFGEQRKKWVKNMDVNKMCKGPCWMDNKNKFFNYMISDNPGHVNFI